MTSREYDLKNAQDRRDLEDKEERFEAWAELKGVPTGAVGAWEWFEEEDGE